MQVGKILHQVDREQRLPRPGGSAGVSRREGLGRGEALARPEPLGLHVPVLPPRSHVHLLLLHTPLRGPAHDLQHGHQPLELPDEYLGKLPDQLVVLLVRPGHLELAPEIQLDDHPNFSLRVRGVDYVQERVFACIKGGKDVIFLIL